MNGVQRGIPGVGQALPWGYRLVSATLRGFYFGCVRIAGAASGPTPRRGARLVVASHRNGAIDGYSVLRAFPGVQFTLSVQLLRHRLLRCMFTGIPVVRSKDTLRHGVERSAFPDPIDAACAHLRAGGDLALFPEGSSEWGHRPLPYRRGAARIVTRLIEEGVPVEVVPLGLHYDSPDRFRSRVEVVVGAPVDLPLRLPGEAVRRWESRVHAALAAALDAVSVNCPIDASFAAARRHAQHCAARGQSDALSFLDAQRRLAEDPAWQTTECPPPPRRPSAVDTLLAACFALLAAPVLFVAERAGRRADARNTVTFFRMAGGLAAAFLWLPVLAAATLCWPAPMTAAWLLAAAGWWRWPGSHFAGVAS